MGAGQSSGVEIGGSSMGYQVLRVYPDSPGSQAGLKAYFDFIVAIGDTRFTKEDGSLREILKASVNQKLKMIVYNTRDKMAREVEIVPTTSWGGSGLLGVSIKHSSFDRADERVWHVVEVDPGSPAHQAGFKAGEDYVIGSDSILQESDDLYNLIEAHEGKALKLFVYNSKTDNCREVICHPNSRWGGRGYLGCEFGHGLLHRIPYKDDNNFNGTIAQAGLGAGNTRLQSNLQAQQVTLSQQHAPSDGFLGATSQSQPQPTVQQQQPYPSRFPAQPGNQLFQQALFSSSSSNGGISQPPSGQAQQTNIGTDQPSQLSSQPQQRPQPIAAVTPQTFAQLANAQHQHEVQQQNQQHQVHHQHQQSYPQQQQQQQQQDNRFMQAPPMQLPPVHQQQQQQPPPPPPQLQQQPPQQHPQSGGAASWNSPNSPSKFAPNVMPQTQCQQAGANYQANQFLPPQQQQTSPGADLGPPLPPQPQQPPTQHQVGQSSVSQVLESSGPPLPPPTSQVAPQTFAQLASHSYSTQEAPQQQSTQFVQTQSQPQAPPPQPLSQQQQQQASQAPAESVSFSHSDVNFH